ncbi:hypothetical protein [Jiella marina]|uniref:hypothetical protein n=1 Tax=Jiella sp. LLJ827 TaxID=2917712 RepID=UPI0021006E96|nr:hypothetical protein [Jiella sp. LLJ827]MCQ0988279.1 hypothetical protein [Jiella sp. LLJ827]
MIGLLSPLHLAMRLMAVLVVLWGALLPVSAMAGIEDGPAVRHLQVHDGHGSACSEGRACDMHAASTTQHDHADGTDSECGVHCIMALPDVSVPQSSVRIVRSVVYLVSAAHLAGLAFPALERPPRL